MAYFPDFSKYTYFETDELSQPLNIGWLERGHAFQTGPVSSEFLAAIEELTKVSVCQTRGLHDCDLCEPAKLITHQWGEEDAYLGSAEIRVFAENGDVFASPTLLLHYIKEHNYLPPDMFIEAVQAMTLPLGEAYFEKLDASGANWMRTLLSEWGQR